MKLRVISLLLAIAMTLLLLPMPVTSAVTTPSELQQQIRNTYKAALRGSGYSSFNGHCGGFVSWQTYSLGIDKTLYASNGNDQFDLYKAMSSTTGGYSIQTYPATKYTLNEALNAITHDGTQDVYNLIVGFQKTNTVAGQRYGHALFVHGIVDGVVYFAECYDMNIGGRYYSEGTPISCTIEQFAAYYDRWTVFEGVVYFGLKTYADVCTRYSCAMKAMAVADGVIYQEPGDPGIHEPKAAEALVSGQWHTVTGLLKTPNGKYWYEIQLNNRTRYVEAENLAMGSLDVSGVSLSNLKAPGYLRKGYGFTMGGSIFSENSTIHCVRVSVYAAEDLQTPVFSADMDVNSKSATLSKAQLNNALTFRKLQPGTYVLRLGVELEVNLLEGNKVTTQMERVDLWEGQFLVVNDWNSYPTIKFDGNGGNAKLNQTVVVKNTTIGSLPTAERSGYAFAGWTLDKAGTKPVNPETLITKNITLYAQWTPGHSGDGGWQETEDGWHYCAGNFPVEGWITFGDLQFYQYSDGTLATGWAWINDTLRYFNAAGALITRLEGPSGTEFEIDAEGKGTLGWLTAGGASDSAQISAEELLQRFEQVEKMPAAGRAMQKLSAGIYLLAVKITSGNMSEQLEEILNYE